MSQRDASLPEQVGRYQVLRRLGSGGMGEVLLAHDERLGRHVALKRVSGGPASDEALRRLEREARATAQLSHPAIVQLFEVLESEHGFFLVLEYVAGETVASRLRHERLPLSLALRLGRDVAEALSEAHAKGILHRDLKAENVLITLREQAKVLDFGLAKGLQDSPLEAASSLTATGTVLGTWRSMAPEQARGGAVDARSDLFSLGVLLYEMVSGRSPFLGQNPADTLHRLFTAKPARLASLRPEVPPELDVLVAQLLEKDPERRPADARSVAAELTDLAERETRRGPDDAFGEAATGQPLTRAAFDEGARSSSGVSGVRAGPRRAAAAVLLLLFGLALTVATRFDAPPAPLRLIAVLEPGVAGPDPSGDLQLVALATLDAILRTLAQVEGVRALDPAQLQGIDGPPLAVARALAADEVLQTRVLAAGGAARLEMRRISGTDGATLWSRLVTLSPQPEDALQSAEAVEIHLRQGLGRAAGSSPPPLAVRREDYTAFLTVQREVRSGNLPFVAALERLEQVLAGSPRFASAHLLVADLAESLFSDTRRSEYLTLAGEHAERVRQLAPEDPRPRVHDVRLALLAGTPERAAAALAELARVAPGEPETLYARALVASARGDVEQAITGLRRLVAERPAWRYLHQLAILEFQRGEVAAARQHLDELLRRSPKNSWGLGALLQLELLHGDLARAEELALELLAIKEHRSYWTNLGLGRYLQGRYAEARQAYARALELQPEHPAALLNLADTELALGREDAARELYQRALAELERRAGKFTLGPADAINRAQCLARLGESERAVESTLEVLAQQGDNAEITYQAALVFVLVGDRTSALLKARQALAAGLDLRWFRIPAFAPLRDALTAQAEP